jgi:hypothetical protein
MSARIETTTKTVAPMRGTTKKEKREASSKIIRLGKKSSI